MVFNLQKHGVFLIICAILTLNIKIAQGKRKIWSFSAKIDLCYFKK